MIFLFLSLILGALFIFCFGDNVGLWESELRSGFFINMGLCLLALLLMYSGIYLIVDHLEFNNINQLFIFLLTISLLCLGCVYLGEGFLSRIFARDNNGLLFRLWCNFFVFVFYSIVLFSARKLIFISRTHSDIRLWNILQVFFLILACCCFINFKILSLSEILFVISLILLAWFITKVRWIGYIKANKSVTLFLLFSFLVLLFLLNKYWLGIMGVNTFSDLYYYKDAYHYYFLFALICFGSGYFSLSFLALLFNMPITDVIEQKRNELDAFKGMGLLLGKSGITGEAFVDKAKREERQYELFERLLKYCVKNTNASSGVFIYDKSFRALADPICDNIDEGTALYLRDKLSRQVNISGAINVQDLNKYHALDSSKLAFRSLYSHNIKLSTPKASGTPETKVLGYLFLLKKYSKGFDDYMADLVRAYIKQVEMVTNNAKRLDSVIEGERLKSEMSIARSVQESLIPNIQEEVSALQLSAFYQPAAEVGGDYYDIAKIDNETTWILVSDVSGKGVNAAFHVAKMKGIFQALSKTKTSIEDFLSQANSAVLSSFEKGVYITLVLLSIDQRAKQIQWARAGHCPILYWNSKTNTLEVLKDKGLGLGIVKDQQFKQLNLIQSRNYNEGDIVVMYTDGITEARNDKDEEYGTNRLKKIICENANQTTDVIEQKLIKSLSDFRGNQQIFDDISSIIIKL